MSAPRRIIEYWLGIEMKFVFSLLIFSLPIVSANADPFATSRRQELHDTFGTYDGEPRLPNGHIDAQRLVAELTDLGANTYNFLIWHAKTDWNDLHEFLPLARKYHIHVWVTLVPPTESPPRYGDTYSEPYRLDFKRWAVEIARLSLREPNLVAWSLDDFSDNAAVAHTFTPEQWHDILSAGRAINSGLAFVPCCYYQHLTPEFAKQYRGLVDGVLFPYMHAAKGMNLKDTDTVGLEVGRFKELFGRDMPVILDVYATRHNSLNETTPEYVERTMRAGKQAADGVMVYTHPNKQESAARYAVIKMLFHEWGSR
ncbi:MAG TPA: hypothetical protein VHE81_12995 [Lacipirellulaceae bacterium]|nr:hypothetical protein [Lacipirellulaceae bacterium]